MHQGANGCTWLDAFNLSMECSRESPT
jgi:hypothetical protein